MASQRLGRSQSTKPTMGYRGRFMCRQQYGYKLITMVVNLLTPDEQSIVTTCDCGFTFAEEPEHIPSNSPLIAIDLYHFAVTDETEIALTIRSSQGEYCACYTVCPTGIQEYSPFFWLDVMKLSQDEKTIRLPDER